MRRKLGIAKNARSSKTSNTKTKHTKKKSAVLVFVGFLAVAVFAFALATFNNNTTKSSKYEQSAQSNQDKRTIVINSSPQGLNVVETSECESIGGESPVMCYFDSEFTDITVTAKKEISKDGVTLIFRSWDGCSEGNINERICKIKITSDGTFSITANYGQSSELTEIELKSSEPPSVNCESGDTNNDGYVSCTVTVVSIPTTVVPDVSYKSDCHWPPNTIEDCHKITFLSGFAGGVISPSPERVCDPEIICKSNWAGTVTKPGKVHIKFPVQGFFSRPDPPVVTGNAIIFRQIADNYNPGTKIFVLSAFYINADPL